MQLFGARVLLFWFTPPSNPCYLPITKEALCIKTARHTFYKSGLCDTELKSCVIKHAAIESELAAESSVDNSQATCVPSITDTGHQTKCKASVYEV